MTQEVELHKNNKVFDWSIPEGPYEFLNAEQIRCFYIRRGGERTGNYRPL